MAFGFRPCIFVSLLSVINAVQARGGVECLVSVAVAAFFIGDGVEHVIDYARRPR
jgi:hypothetical protein